MRNTSPAPRSAEISLTGVTFQELHWGHEGPDYFSTKRPPQRGAQEIAEARVYGQEAIGVIRFELMDDAGQVLGVAPAVRTGSGVDDGEYSLRVPVPARSFRFRITGQDVRGQPFARVFNRLFQPGTEAPPAPQLLQGMTPQQTAQLQKLLESSRAQMSAMFDAALRADGEGWVRIPRTEVAQAVYEPLLAPGGHPIGIRVQFSVRFSAAGSYAVRPHVFPLYANSAWRGAVTMKVLDGRVAPAPVNTAADSLANVIRYGGDAQYQGGVVYRFLFEMVPRYVIRNKAGTRLCLFMEEFRAAGRLPLWNAIAADSTPVRYRVDLSNLGFNADTEPMAPQRTFYESLLSEGAPDCGPAPNMNF